MGEVVNTMGTGFTTVLAAVWDAVGDVVTTITSQPLLLIPVCP